MNGERSKQRDTTNQSHPRFGFFSVNQSSSQRLFRFGQTTTAPVWIEIESSEPTSVRGMPLLSMTPLPPLPFASHPISHRAELLLVYPPQQESVLPVGVSVGDPPNPKQPTRETAPESPPRLVHSETNIDIIKPQSQPHFAVIHPILPTAPT